MTRTPPPDYRELFYSVVGSLFRRTWDDPPGERLEDLPPHALARDAAYLAERLIKRSDENRHFKVATCLLIFAGALALFGTRTVDLGNEGEARTTSDWVWDVVAAVIVTWAGLLAIALVSAFLMSWVSKPIDGWLGRREHRRRRNDARSGAG